MQVNFENWPEAVIFQFRSTTEEPVTMLPARILSLRQYPGQLSSFTVLNLKRNTYVRVAVQTLWPR